MPKEYKIMNMHSFPAQDCAKYIVLDLETLADTHLYERYRRSDPRAAPMRWPFRRVVAASVMAITVENGIWQVDDFRSFTDTNDFVLARKLFSWVAERPYHRLCTFGGLNEDIPVLKTLAMENGLKLPRQFRHMEKDRLGFLHTDLAVVLRAGAGQFPHMTELSTRLGLPSKLAGSAGQVPHMVAESRLQDAAAISEVDVLTTACLLASHLVTLGDVVSLNAAYFVTMQAVRNRRPRAKYHRELGNYMAKARRQMIDDQRRWLETC